MSGRESRVVLVTGGGKGIGYAIAESFARLGDTVIICGRKKSRLEASAERLAKWGKEIAVFTCDVTAPDEVSDLAEDVDFEYHGLDVLVNNVGNFNYKSTMNHTWEEFQEIIESNLSSTFIMCRHMLPLLRKSKNGRIINIAASYASTGKAFPQFGPFAAAKAGLISLTKSMANELAEEGITVNAVSPGMIDTGVYPEEVIERWKIAIPMGRFGHPWEVARAVTFLAAQECGYLTGTEIKVGGGWEGELPK